MQREDCNLSHSVEERRSPRTRQVLGKSERMLFFLVILGQNSLCVNAAAEGLQKRTEIMERWQQHRFQVKEGRWVEEIPQRWKKLEGEDWSKTKKEAKTLRCTFLNACSVEYREEVHEKIQRIMRYLLWD